MRSEKKRPDGWTAKDEDDLTSLVDEIFKVCGPQAVADTRVACEKMEKSLNLEGNT